MVGAWTLSDGVAQFDYLACRLGDTRAGAAFAAGRATVLVEDSDGSCAATDPAAPAALLDCIETLQVHRAHIALITHQSHAAALLGGLAG